MRAGQAGLRMLPLTTDQRPLSIDPSRQVKRVSPKNVSRETFFGCSLRLQILKVELSFFGILNSYNLQPAYPPKSAEGGQPAANTKTALNNTAFAWWTISDSNR
jgi:hypothetical protein